jgi:hypothetical protein
MSWTGLIMLHTYFAVPQIIFVLLIKKCRVRVFPS